MKYLRFFEENNKEFSKEFKKYIGKYVILDYRVGSLSQEKQPYLLCKVINVGLGDDYLYRVKFDYYHKELADLVGPSSLQLKNFHVLEVFDKLKDAKEKYHILMNTKKYNL